MAVFVVIATSSCVVGWEGSTVSGYKDTNAPQGNVKENMQLDLGVGATVFQGSDRR